MNNYEHLLPWLALIYWNEDLTRMYPFDEDDYRYAVLVMEHI